MTSLRCVKRVVHVHLPEGLLDQGIVPDLHEDVRLALEAEGEGVGLEAREDDLQVLETGELRQEGRGR